MWDARTWSKLFRIVAHTDSVNACAVSPNGKYFVSASTDCTLKVWNLRTILELESILADYRKLRPDEWGRLLMAMSLTGHTGSVNDCAVSPDSAFIVSASSDRTLRVWDVRTGQSRYELRGHRRDVNGCAVSRDGRLIASVSTDQTIKVWATANGECLATLYVDGPLADCAWLPAGEGVVATGAGGVYFFKVTENTRKVVSPSHPAN